MEFYDKSRSYFFNVCNGSILASLMPVFGLTVGKTHLYQKLNYDEYLKNFSS